MQNCVLYKNHRVGQESTRNQVTHDRREGAHWFLSGFQEGWTDRREVSPDRWPDGDFDWSHMGVNCQLLSKNLACQIVPQRQQETHLPSATKGRQHLFLRQHHANHHSKVHRQGPVGPASLLQEVECFPALSTRRARCVHPIPGRGGFQQFFFG